MKTVAEIYAEGDARRADEAVRAARYHARMRAFAARLAAGLAAISCASNALLLLVGLERWWVLLLAAAPGAASGLLIARGQLGILGGMIANCLCHCLYYGLALAIGGISVRGWDMLGAGIWCASLLISWPMVGGIAGFIQDWHERDHLLV